MPHKKRRAVKTALLGAAATALTVKGALTSPIGVVAEDPLDKLKLNVDQKKQQVLTESRKALDQAAARLVTSLVPVSTSAVGSPVPTPRPSPDSQVRPSGIAATELPPGLPYRPAFIRRVLIEAAQRICDEYGVTLDWLYRGDRSKLPHHLAIDIARIEAAELNH